MTPEQPVREREALIELTDANGACWVRRRAIEAVSGPVAIKGGPPTRRLSLKGGVQFYCLDTSENGKALRLRGWGTEPAKPVGKADETEEK